MCHPDLLKGGWRVVRQMNLIETYSDNVHLARMILEQRDFITQINPGIMVNGVGNRFNANAKLYDEQSHLRSEQQLYPNRQQLNAIGTAELIERSVFRGWKSFNQPAKCFLAWASGNRQCQYHRQQSQCERL